MDISELVSMMVEDLAVANVTGELEVADRYGYPLENEDWERIVAITLWPLVKLMILSDDNNMIDRILSDDEPDEVQITVDLSDK